MWLVEEEDSGQGLTAEGATGRRQQPSTYSRGHDRKKTKLTVKDGRGRKKVVIRGWSNGRGECGWKDVATAVVEEEKEMVASG
ncbi:hypothetical protein BHE74_00036858 [Ensete ventricosum]|nr:hypothetical protein BHE74_00036858 [Ensete ventricosum]